MTKLQQRPTLLCLITTTTEIFAAMSGVLWFTSEAAAQQPEAQVKVAPPTTSHESQQWGHPHPIPVPVGPLAQYDPTSDAVIEGWNPSDVYLRGYEDVIPLQAVAPARNRTPRLQHPGEEEQVQQKLQALQMKTGKKPNILIFLTDDVGWHDVGFNGGGVSVGSATHHMDRLAREGLNLTSFYSMPSCTPTRAAILTGRLPIRTGLLRPTMYGEKGGLGGEITLSRLMSDAGYTTQAIGKWHVGENEESQPQNVVDDGPKWKRP